MPAAGAVLPVHVCYESGYLPLHLVLDVISKAKSRGEGKRGSRGLWGYNREVKAQQVLSEMHMPMHDDVAHRHLDG